MQTPATFKGDYLKRFLQGIAVGAVATIVIGFWQGGWVTGGTAKDMATASAEKATTVALMPSCKTMFVANADAMAKFKAEKSSYARERLVRDSVKEINGVSPSSKLVDACAASISSDLVKSAAAPKT